MSVGTEVTEVYATGSIIDVMSSTKMVSTLVQALTILRTSFRHFTRLSWFEEARLSPYGVTLPKELHKTLTDAELKGRRLMIIGDVHGCFDELEDILLKADARTNNYCIVFVGDLVNKGPKNAEVIKLARNLKSFSVRGNHDEVCMLEWEKSVRQHTPLPHSFQWMKELTKEELEWFFDMPYTLTIPSLNAIVVHAGLVPGISIKEQKIDDMITMRYIVWNKLSRRYEVTANSNEGSLWAGSWKGNEHVYFGHDAIHKLQLAPHATGLDTGCVYGGHLTAVFPTASDRCSHRIDVPAKRIHKNPFK